MFYLFEKVTVTKKKALKPLFSPCSVLSAAWSVCKLLNCNWGSVTSGPCVRPKCALFVLWKSKETYRNPSASLLSEFSSNLFFVARFNFPIFFFSHPLVMTLVKISIIILSHNLFPTAKTETERERGSRRRCVTSRQFWKHLQRRISSWDLSTFYYLLAKFTFPSECYWILRYVFYWARSSCDCQTTLQPYLY